MPMIYEMDTDKGGYFIRCGGCLMKSYSAADIENHYCGNCHRFHDDYFGPNALRTDAQVAIEQERARKPTTRPKLVLIAPPSHLKRLK